ncbi:MAG: protein kinase [Rhodopirellula sp. JB044]|uniref:protein kinase domain-containing protein n=1 Tax=Rhodopirellula sp. JB044 TaxID=3342844 RepID=UPI00370A9BEB
MNAFDTDSNDWSDDEPMVMRRLSPHQQGRLAELLEQYMAEMERGVAPSVESLTRENPDLREALRECVDGLLNLHQLAFDPPVAAADERVVDDANLLGDFELHEEIGRGGMGVVYRATQRSLRRDVAIKLLPLGSMLDEQKLTRFRHEAEAAACLQHPHIVPIFAVGCEKGTHYYAMQFIAGDSLDQVIQRVNRGHASSSWRTVVKQAISVADGLHAAHELGIVHRDIKPSNLIVDQDGKVWISDFGLARVQNDVSLTQSGDVIGTMRYMSPEQTRGESALVDGLADVYSLGATLYEVLCGHPAHDGEDALAILRQIDEDAVVPLRNRFREIPRDLDTVIAKAMSKRRDDRYETARDFADDLQRVLDGEPTVARPPSVLDHFARYAVRYRAWVATATVIGMLTIAGFVIGTFLLAAEKSVSDANALRAMANERIAREAIDGLGSQVAELYADVPAASFARQQLLMRVLVYYERLAAQTDTADDQNFERRIDLATTYGKIGELQGELGENDRAIDSLRRSERLLSTIAASNQGDTDVQLQWTISQNNLAQRYAVSGELQQAADWFGKAIINQTRIQSDENVRATQNIRATRELATTLNNLGQLLSDTENVEQAESVYRRAIDMLDGRAELTELRGTIQSNLAGVISKRDPAQACLLARRSLDAQIARLEKNPGDAEAATRVILTLNTLATSQAEQSDHRAAIETLRQAIDISQQLRSRWPEQPIYRRDLGISLNHLGLSLAAIGKLQFALEAFDRANENAVVLQKAFPNDAEIRSMSGGILNNLGFLSEQLGERQNARDYYAQAIEQQEKAVSLAPQVPRYRAFLDKHQTNLHDLGGEP